MNKNNNIDLQAFEELQDRLAEEETPVKRGIPKMKPEDAKERNRKKVNNRTEKVRWEEIE